MSNLLESKKVLAILWILGGLILLFIVFGLGIAVGYQRAGFAAGFENNYYRNFYGGGGPPVSAVAGHGTVGTVIDVGTSTISVEDQQNNERSVAISSGTVIREANSNLTISDVVVGDQIAVIGEPNDQGQVAARFIRIFPASSSLPMPPMPSSVPSSSSQ